MALTSTEEALVRQLLDEQAAILSLAGNEATITSKLAATKVTLSDLAAAGSLNDTDLLLVRQSTTDKSVTPLDIKNYALSDSASKKGVQAGDYNTAAATGTADSITATYSPSVLALEDGLTLFVRAVSANATTTPTFSPSGLTAKTIVKGNNLALVAGDIAGAGHWIGLQYDATLDKWVLLNPAKGVIASTAYKELQSINATVAGNALTLVLNPTALDFRSSTLTTGAPNTRTVSDALSLVVPSGATLGTTNNIAARLVLIAIDNAGTVELAVINQSGGINLNESGVISTTTISAAASSASVAYSTTGRTNVPYRVVGFIDITQATAGVWATSPSLIQGSGGQTLAAMSSLGYGQTWQNVTSSRSASTTYYNTTGKPIIACITTYVAINYYSYVNGVQVGGNGSDGSILTRDQTVLVIPPGGSYYSTSAGITHWAELR